MKVSSKTSYALRLLLDLAMQREHGVVRLADIARRRKIPPKFLEQIVLVLKRAGLVGSRRGPKGGYFLSSAPSSITLAAVLRLTEGGGWNSARPDEPRNPFQEVWRDIGRYTEEKLRRTTLQDMAERAEVMAAEHPREYVI